MKIALSILMFASVLSAEPLVDVLSRMDRAAAEFRSLSARMKRVQFTAVLGESSEMEGELRLKRMKGGTLGIIDFQQPVEANRVYRRGIGVRLLSQGEYRGLDGRPEIHLEHGPDPASRLWDFLRELKKSYDFKEGGAEKVNGVQTTRIELTPKSDELEKADY